MRRITFNLVQIRQCDFCCCFSATINLMSGFIFEIAQRKSDSRFNLAFRAFVFMVITFEKADSQRYCMLMRKQSAMIMVLQQLLGMYSS